MSDTPWTGGRVSERATVVLCPNPGPMTLEGTNTWVLHSPSTNEAVVIDPGPLDEDHLQRVLRYADELGARIALTLLTHHHHDHAESADRWATLTGAPIRGAGRGRPFVHEERIEVGDITIRVLLTPGHTADSVSFVWAAERLMLTGDTVLGRGTSIVAHPDGALRPYLASLDLLLEAAQAAPLRLGPGHGPVHEDAKAVLSAYISHRRDRLEQVRTALREGAQDAPDVAQAVVERVYAEVPRSVWPAAKATVQAQLDYLSEPGAAAAPRPAE
ncbi:MBL fold metallo-hydrolase [Metallococcus carri]|uniref:MBL fold metallo-hydrolase n=1 Tax=Metallococcus carri TaxID=1656884 RepID=UPI002E29BFCC|nr:MBL fold metallo-hydrolase [Metallococcus carri]